MRPLVLAQQMALEALAVVHHPSDTETERWTYPGAIKARADTLKALVARGLAQRRGYQYCISLAGESWLKNVATREPSPPFNQPLTPRAIGLQIKANLSEALAATIHSPSDVAKVRKPLKRALDLCVAFLMHSETGP